MVHLIGNVCNDGQSRQLPDGSQVVSSSIAVNEKFKDKQGNSKESTEFVNITMFRRQAEIFNQYVKKGSSLYVQGKLKTSSWDSNGEKKYKTEVVVSNFQILSSKAGQIQQQTPAQDFGDAPPAYQDENLPF